MHKCFEEIESHPANKYRQKVPTLFGLNGNQMTMEHCFTLQLPDPKPRGAKPMHIVMSHCPLCGTSLKEEQSDD